jgi:hypothetical protein
LPKKAAVYPAGQYKLTFSPFFSENGAWRGGECHSCHSGQRAVSAKNIRKHSSLTRFSCFPGPNTRQVSKALGRDYKNVHGDVAVLSEIGLLEKDARGRITAPFDEIVIRARDPRVAPKAA